jgi:hypothetical protein
LDAIVAIAARDVLPDPAAVAAQLGAPAPAGITRASAEHASPAAGDRETQAGAGRGARTDDLVARALALAAETFAPAGLWREVPAAAFAVIYAGEGENAPRSPLAGMHLKAERLALFAATLGPAVSERITLLFAAREFALAAALDAAASLGAERAAERVEHDYRSRLAASGALKPQTRLLRYSPGYCGWHVSGQKALFAALRPERIGVRLRLSHLMEPLKSVSGVIVAGPATIHVFASDYPFCGECRTQACRERLASLRG